MGGTALRRVAIMGGAGAGKSTLARALGARLGCPVTHLDRIVYGADWAPVADDRVRAEVATLAAGPSWVIEGTFAHLFDLILPAADLAVWIEQPWPVRLWRAWRKTRIHRGRPRADRPDGAEEGFGLDYARTVMSFGRFTPQVATVLERAATTPIRVLRGDAEVAAFIDEAGKAA